MQNIICLESLPPVFFVIENVMIAIELYKGAVDINEELGNRTIDAIPKLMRHVNDIVSWRSKIQRLFPIHGLCI